LKLLQKSSLYFIALLIPIFLGSAFIFHAIIHYEIDEDTDHYLMGQMTMAQQMLAHSDSARRVASFTQGEMTIRQLPARRKPAIFFSDSIGRDHRKRALPYRKITGYFEKDGAYYSIVVLHSKVRDEEVVEMIVKSLVIMFGLLLLGLLALNGILSRSLWRPFYTTLAQLEKMSFTQKTPTQFSSSSTREFNALNNALNRMVTKMFRDYENQKQFTENASHELQTPLAVIKSKTDLLLQSRSASEQDMMLITDIERAVSRLTHLNRSLLLLSKLENRQFDESTSIHLGTFFDRVMASFEDRILLKHIRVQKVYRDDVMVVMNAMTAEVLLSNLIQNAIRYNFSANGVIIIELTKSYFKISNTGAELRGDPQRLFDRFIKFNTNSESMGLGLSIVRQICEYYSFTIAYSYEKDFHHFTIRFPDR